MYFFYDDVVAQTKKYLPAGGSGWARCVSVSRIACVAEMIKDGAEVLSFSLRGNSDIVEIEEEIKL